MKENLHKNNIYRFSVSITKCLAVGLGPVSVSKASSWEEKLDTEGKNKNRLEPTGLPVPVTTSNHDGLQVLLFFSFQS